MKGEKARAASSSRIRSIEVTPVRLCMRSPLRMSIATVLHRECVLVQVATEDGITGLGEAVLAPYFTGENVAGAALAIQRHLAPMLVGEGVLDLEAAVTRMARALQGNPAAKAAVEIALHDAAAKTLGVPLNQLLGGEVRRRVPATWHVVAGSAAEVAEECRAGLEAGFGAIKLKVGTLSVEDDLRRLAAVRATVGEEVEIRPDANQAWTFAEAKRFLEGAREARIQFIEQPLHRDDVYAMAHLKSLGLAPIAPDEGVYDAVQAMAYLRAGAADGFVPKLTKAGGIIATRRLAAVAQAAGAGLHLAGMPGESSICAAAAVHLGVTLSHLPWGGGISPHAAQDDLVREPLKLESGGYAPPPGSGLGVELDPQALARARFEV